MHRAIASLMEELEAVDWYYQRADVTQDESLKAILLHNAHEEVEHAMMTLEWIRRQDPVFDANMREYLFREGDIVAAEVAAKGEPPSAGKPTAVPSDPVRRGGSLRRSIGSLRGGERK